jgi:hypothetical protein
MQTWARAADVGALGPVGDLLRHLGEVRGQGITRFWNYWAHRWGNAMVYMYGLNRGSIVGHLGYAALRILCSLLNRWLSDP